MKITSIRFKLLAGGITLVLLPLIVISILSISKSSTALSDLSSKNAAAIAADLAGLVDQTLKEEIKLAEVIATDKEVVNVLAQVHKGGTDGATEEAKGLYASLGKKFSRLGTSYQGIFVTDAKGSLVTGILDDGKEYKGSNVGDREYFQAAKNTGKTTISDIFRSKITDKLISVICVPIQTETNEFVGTLGLVMKVEFFTELVSGRKVGTTGYGYMTDHKALMLAHPLPKHILTLDLSKQAGMETFVRRMLAGERGVEKYTFNGVDKISGFCPLSVTNWHVAVTQNESEFLEAAHSIRNASLIVSLVAILLTIVAVAYSAGLIVKPINRAISSLKDIAEGEGDLTMRLDAKSKDEIGELGFWFNTFIEKLQGIIKRIAENSSNVNSSANQLSAIARELSDGSVDTSQRAANVATASEEMSANLNNVAAAMEESSTNTNMVASAAEEMSSTITEIAENAERASNVSRQAVLQAQKASGKMGELGNAAQQISMVTETITEISEQTNLLALNATIEAARAGEAGKGFAVVANEIKELAKQTAQATLNIKKQIDEVQQTTKSTVTEINQISEIIDGVNDIVTTIASAVVEQTAATREIASNIAQASQGIQEVNENVNQSSVVAGTIAEDIAKVNLAATSMSENSRQVQNSSADLQQMAAELNTIVGSFKI